jgi:single-stranded DNA-binding protein
VSYATLVVSLADAPKAVLVNGKEMLEAAATTANADPANLTIRVIAGSTVASAFSTKQQNQRLIASGDLILDENLGPIVYARVICDGHEDQFLNEVTIVGRVAGEARVAESGKSCSRSLAVNRFEAGKEVTDWFKVRGFGHWKDRLESVPKGALVSVAGFLDQRTNRDGGTYCELKARSLRVHARSKGAGTNPAQGTTAAGYSAEDFSGENEAENMPFNWS